MKLGQRVVLKCDSEMKGTITRLFVRDGFQVTYDGKRDERGKRIRGGRYEYSVNYLDYFTVITN